MPILWIPVRLGPSSNERRVSPTQAPTNFIVEQPGYEILFGEPSSWQGVRERLGRYSLRAVLDVVARVSAFLNNVEGELQEADAQKRIFDGFFGDAGVPAWQWVVDERRRKPELRAVVPFGELQLINAVKVALLCMPVEDRASQEDLKELGEALLMISDLMWSQLDPAVPSQRDAPIPPAWQQMLLANQLFHSGGTFRNDLARSHELYLLDRAELRTHPDYVDLPAAARRVTGMDPRTLWGVLFAMGAHWRMIDADGLYGCGGAVDRETYFAAHFTFASEEVERFFRLCAAPAEQIQAEVQGRYSLERLDPLDALPLAKMPLLTLGTMAYAVSSKLLDEKLTRGLYHFFLDPTFSTNERERFFHYMGAVFEWYVAELFKRVYPPQSGRYIGEPVLQQRIPGKKCDGLILFGDSMVLVECKATLFPYEVRTGRNWEKYRRIRKDVVLDGADQLSATIDAITAGVLRQDGIDPRFIHSYLPIVVTHEDVGMVRPLHRMVMEDVGKRGLLSQGGVLPLQVVSIAELEVLEEDLHDGLSLQHLLAEKVAQEDWITESLRNYCFACRPHLMGRRNAHLLRRFDLLAHEASAFFGERRRSEEM